MGGKEREIDREKGGQRQEVDRYRQSGDIYLLQLSLTRPFSSLSPMGERREKRRGGEERKRGSDSKEVDGIEHWERREDVGQTGLFIIKGVF